MGFPRCTLQAWHSLCVRRRLWNLLIVPWKLISYYAIEASSNLAEERGKYSTFEGSLVEQRILPIDSIELLQDSARTNI